MLDRGYEELLKYCSPCVLAALKKYDDSLFSAEKEIDQIFYAKMGAQLIDACSNFNTKKTEEEDGVPPEKIDCACLMEHYTKKSANSDFRARWELMVKEMYDDFNKRESRKHFDLSEADDPTFTQLFINYRLGRAICTFGDRHPNLFFSQTERDHDMKIFKIVHEAIQ